MDSLRRELRPLYLLAALLHDIGKSNSSFQNLVRGNREKRQPVRHEILSALLVSGDSFLKPWLRGALTEQEIWAVSWSVGGHHLQMQEQTELDSESPLLKLAGSDKTVTMYLGHPEIRSLLLLVKDLLEELGRFPGGPPILQDQTFAIRENHSDSIDPLICALVKDSRKAWSACRVDWQFVQRLAMLKSLLIAADVAGSALV
ncbi:MAG TPA: CRISPR-associated endonuclease Cas3'', partial [Candidatus Avalokitesvara rifleensis]|uniref:CRISPR-associated endonuclease Cas3'' n=1 Tax=Candidatus Avalokitesvara rifleensis TaxID=3367620 RepID=UPI00402A2A7E